MSFQGVSVSVPTVEVTYPDPTQTVTARFDFHSWDDARILFSSLERARDFKADVRNGKASLGLVVQPVLDGWEDPIIVQPPGWSLELDPEPLFRDLVIAALLAATKKDARDWQPEPILKDVYRKAKTSEGVRFHFLLVPMKMFVMASDGTPVTDIRITNYQGSEPKVFTNSVGMRLVLIGPGEFTMGEESAKHPQRIEKQFFLAIYETTNDQYLRVMGKLPSKGALDFSADDPPKYPARRVSWNNAKRFCELLSDLPDEKKAGRKYRLPTEAEWEYACRAGTTTPFNTGRFLTTIDANIGNARGGPVRVGMYPPNDFGLYDMHGNVSEWCLDLIGDEHPLKGGCWTEEPASGYRMLMGPEWGMVNFGFRVVCEQ